MATIRYAQRADRGGRRYQEDSVVVWPSAEAPEPGDIERKKQGVDLIAVLSDGMGGHAAGDVASRAICEAFLADILSTAGEAAVVRLRSALDRANSTLETMILRDASLRSMGGTCVGLTITDENAHWISVGDSPLWLWRAGELSRLNEDHSLAPLLDDLVADGRMDAQEAANDPRRHYLRSAVTGEELDLVDAPETPLVLEIGDILLLASDGVLTLPDDEIRQVIEVRARGSVEEIADAVLSAVLATGDPHQDNISVIVVQIS